MFREEEKAVEDEMIEAVQHTNPDEIQLDDDFESDEEETVKEVRVQQQMVPSTVFGQLHKEDEDDDDE